MPNIRKTVATALTATAVVGGAIGLSATEAKAQSAAEARVNSYYSAVAAGMRAIGEYGYAADVLTDIGEQAHVLTQGARICVEIFPGETTPQMFFNDTLAKGYSLAVASDLLVMSTAAALILCPQYAWMVETSSSQPATYYAPSVRLYEESACTLRPETNIRSGPSTNSAVIGNESTLISDAIQIHSTSLQDDGMNWSWIGFQGNDGRTAGWVRSDFIQDCF